MEALRHGAGSQQRRHDAARLPHPAHPAISCPAICSARASQTPDLAFNTAASFITNTNWQAYSGESSLSNFSQMAVITFLMTDQRGYRRCRRRWLHSRVEPQERPADIGNYWVDFTRVIYRLLLPLCFVMALVYVWQGMPQTLTCRRRSSRRSKASSNS